MEALITVFIYSLVEMVEMRVALAEDVDATFKLADDYSGDEYTRFMGYDDLNPNYEMVCDLACELDDLDSKIRASFAIKA